MGEIAYAKKVQAQVDSLLNVGVKPEHITVVGASLGAYITLESAIRIRNPKMNFAILGLCSTYALEYFKEAKEQFVGNFLSIYERTDEKKTCKELFIKSSKHSVFKEVELNMGNGHAFLFGPYQEWITPLVKWIHNSK